MQKVPIRGRAADQRVLDALLRRAAGGRGGALLIRGEPGTGKSTLLRHVAGAATGTVLRTAGLADEAALPYAALHRLLQPLSDRPPDLVERAISGGGCPPEDRVRLSMAVLDLLASSAPVVCCVDDAHLLDPASADTLGFVARRVGPHRVAVVFTAGGDGAADDPVPGVPCRWISGLAQPDSRALLGDVVPGGLPTDVAGALVDLARGNPQALVDLARSLTPAQCRGEAPLPRGLPLDSPLRRAYRAQLALLPADTRWLLLLAAADDHLDATELVRAARASGTDLTALAAAELCGVLRVHGDRLTFPRPLARTVTYDEAPMGQRQAAHRLLAATLDPVRHRLRVALHRVAGATEPTAADADDLAACGSGSVEALERSADLTTDPALASARLVAAARHAWTAGQPHRARMLLRRTAQGGAADLLAGEIELRSGPPASALRTLLTAADRLPPALAARALAFAGDALCYAGNHARLPGLARRAAALPAELPAELPVRYLAGMAAMLRGRHRDAVTDLRRVVELGSPSNDPTELIWAATACLLLADDAGADHLAGRAAEAGDVSARPRALEIRAYAEYWLGRLDAAQTTALDGMREAEAAAQDNVADTFAGLLAMMAARRGDGAACRRYAALATRRPSADLMNRPHALSEWALALLDLAADRPADAAARITTIADPRTGRGQLVVYMMATPDLAEAAPVDVGAFTEWAEGTGDPLRRALAARCRALAHRGDGPETHFREALRLHRATGNDFERARTEMLSRGRTQVRSALATFERLGLDAWAARARDALRAADEDPTTGTLTAQQLQIARMVAAGATNREVAAQLYLSTRTVDHHMRNIFVRLGIRSRIELAKLFS
ncbi:helix-turn-helix transcriptional regulator [Virgisporangium ochraceum]|uniref:Helix-turn-helix transcriptional regulator n=2 Tax=Virgisporangium ochraceum TaxID=65505 RepID=A0A8J3ZPW5_9ACTN|nr:helix-turn-helix transcriptional regulator [Virgisporangium ochraceum]